MDPAITLPLAEVWTAVFGLVIASLAALSVFTLRTIIGRIDTAVSELKLVDHKIGAYISATEARLARMEEWMRSHERYEHPPHSHPIQVAGQEPPFP